MGIRINGDPAALAQRVRAIALDVDPALRLGDVRSLEDLVWEQDVPGTIAASTVVGTMENPMAGSMDVEGTEAGTGTLLLAADGRYLGGTASSKGDMKIKTAMLPDPIPVKVTRSTTISVVP